MPKRLAEIVAARIAQQQAREAQRTAPDVVPFACPRCRAARTYPAASVRPRQRRAVHDCPCGGPLLRVTGRRQ